MFMLQKSCLDLVVIMFMHLDVCSVEFEADITRSQENQNCVRFEDFTALTMMIF